MKKWLPKITLFIGMYTITATIIGCESGSLLAGLSLGLLSSTLKTGWAIVHSWWYDTF